MDMEASKLRWRGKLTLYRSVQSQPDLIKRSTPSAERTKLLERADVAKPTYRPRPHTAEASVRLEGMRMVQKPHVRPNTAVSSRITSAHSFSDKQRVTSPSDTSSSRQQLTRRALAGKNRPHTANSRVECLKELLDSRGEKYMTGYGKEQIIQKVRAQSCRRRSARLTPADRERILSNHKQTAEEKVHNYYTLLVDKKRQEEDMAEKRALAAERLRKAIWKVLWIIRWKRAMVAISLDNMVMTAMEMDWHTRNTDASDSQFRKEDYSRASVATKVPAWAVKILKKPPEWRTMTECNKLHTLLRPLKAFERFTEKIQQAMCRAMRYEFVEAKRIILRKGHPGVCFYFIYSGSTFVDVEDVNNNNEVFIKTAAILHRGESFGNIVETNQELALLRDNVRAATITCRQDCELLTVDNEVFGQICPTIFEQELHEKIEFVRTLPIFVSTMWTEQQLQSLCSDAQIKQYKNEKVIIADNAVDEWIYVCMQGKCRVIRCLTMECDDDEMQLTNRSFRELECSAHLFSNIINEGRLGGERRRSSGTPSAKGQRNRFKSENAEDSKAKINKVQMLNSMALEWFKAHEQSSTDIQLLVKVEEMRRKTKEETVEQGNNISGMKTLSTLMNELMVNMRKNGAEAIFIELAQIHPKDVFDIHSILRKGEDVSKGGHLILVSCGATMLRLKKSEFFRRASFEALEYMKTITADEKYPSEKELLDRYESSHSWQMYKDKTLSKVVTEQRAAVGGQPASDVNHLQAERQHRNTKLLRTLQFHERVERNEHRMDEMKLNRPLFQFEIDRLQQENEQKKEPEVDSASPQSHQKRRVSADGVLPLFIEHMILESQTTPPPTSNIQ